MSAQIDSRGQRFAAALTTILLAVVLLAAPSTTATLLLVAQTALFAVGAVCGAQRTPYAWVFRHVVRPHISSPGELEDTAPPRFAQAVGLSFTLVALVAYLSGASLLGAVGTGLALGAAFLNAAFGFCLGCEAYLLVRRVVPTTSNHQRAGHTPVTTKG